MPEDSQRRELQERYDSPDWGIRIAIMMRTADGGDERRGQYHLEDITTGAKRWGLVSQSNPRYHESLYYTEKKSFILLLRAREPRYVLADREVAAGDVPEIAREFGPVTDIESIAYLYDDAQALAWFEKHKDEHKVPAWLRDVPEGIQAGQAPPPATPPKFNRPRKQKKYTSYPDLAAEAAIVCLRNPEMSDAAIARALNVAPSTLSRCEAWRDRRQNLRITKLPPRGRKLDDGAVDDIPSDARRRPRRREIDY